jgi:hypothetical protein
VVVAWIRRRSRHSRHQGELGERERRSEHRQQGRRVGADQGRPPVALQPAPLARALLELVLVVDAGAEGNPKRPARKPKPKRQVDVLVVEEELLGEPSHALEERPRDRQAGAGDEARLDVGALDVGALPRSSRPGDAGEVDQATTGVDHPALLRGHQALPRGPAAVVAQRSLDRLPKPLCRSGVGVEEDQQLAGGRRGPLVGPRREAEVGIRLDHRRPRGDLADRVDGVVGGVVVDHDQLVFGAQLVADRG